MAQLPSTISEWMPLANSEFISPAASTALTVPAVPAAQVPKGAQYVGILMCQGAGGFIYLRTDGAAAVATITGGIQLAPGDYRVVYGIKALQGIRAIRTAATVALACEYYYFRPEL